MRGPVHRQRLSTEFQRRLQQQPDLSDAAVDSRHNVFGRRHCHGPGRITRRRAVAAWSNGSPRTTRRTASCTAQCGGCGSTPHGRHRGIGPAWHHGAGAQGTCWCPTSALPACCASHTAPCRPAPPSAPAASTRVTRSRCRPFSRCRSPPACRGPDVRVLCGQQLHRGSFDRLGQRQRPAGTGTWLRAGTTVAELGKNPDQYNRSAWPSPPTGPCTSSTSTSPVRGRSPAAARPRTVDAACV